jgi:signal peptidase I
VEDQNVVVAEEQPASAPETQPAPPTRGFIAEWTVTILVLLFGTTTLIQAFVIPTPSMEDTLLIGDHLLVDKLAYAPGGSVSKWLLPYEDIKRGDIIVFRYPVDIQQTFVKRCIGVPGDRIRLVDKQLILNGHAATEPYVYHKLAYIESYRDDFPDASGLGGSEAAQDMLQNHVVNGEVVVPPGFYFAMGDNRDLSYDSRFWGFVPRANIIGKPLLIYWSFDASTAALTESKQTIPHLIDMVIHFPTKTRWSRTMRLLHGYPLN